MKRRRAVQNLFLQKSYWWIGSKNLVTKQLKARQGKSNPTNRIITMQAILQQRNSYFQQEQQMPLEVEKRSKIGLTEIAMLYWSILYEVIDLAFLTSETLLNELPTQFANVFFVVKQDEVIDEYELVVVQCNQFQHYLLDIKIFVLSLQFYRKQEQRLFQGSK
ncbi:unnamed protein product (macronuclear) [Paramecium tetraurelia]|uniref:Uncharacterized protein n=1 Tax=Paramecium tetraurelia TaxID=5888 RepID=A0BJG5_PARTE|nr:uncharacterized protein GSPATT00029309001 [Paramecium tetraurelia]CAK58682.1 unnamed protein product [Paramecium tetraurelia]|eukprot:XP_001426080.1 hypothetical protein (macronuclear) [Paramecium tetraurelia strain d4-2]